MDDAERERIKSEMSRIWIQSVVQPYTKINLHYWIFKLKLLIKKLQDNGHPDDKADCAYMSCTLKRLHRALKVLSGA